MCSYYYLVSVAEGLLLFLTSVSSLIEVLHAPWCGVEGVVILRAVVYPPKVIDLQVTRAYKVVPKIDLCRKVTCCRVYATAEVEQYRG